MPIKAIYPGTFDPVTNGHGEIITRASKLFSEVVVAVASNPTKQPCFDLAKRVEMIEHVTQHLPNITVVGFSGLLVNFAKEHNASVLVRGVRGVSDFEYEFQLASLNRQLSPDLETIFLTPSAENSFISSTIVKEVTLHDGDVSTFVHPIVKSALDKALKPKN